MTNISDEWVMSGRPVPGGSLAGGVLQDRISGEVGRQQITYTYDPSGRRIAKDVDGQVTKYVYDGDHCIAEYDGSNNLLRKYIHGPSIDEPICMIEAAGGYAGTYYYHFDALGSVVALSDADGDTVEVYEYDVYGQVAASDPNHPNRFMFTGREFDAETGLYYYRARYYNPTIGRFLQTDPIGYADGMNVYAYCGNNSVGRRDAYGNKAEVIYAYVLCGTQVFKLTGEWNIAGVAYLFGVDPIGVEHLFGNVLNIIPDAGTQEHTGTTLIGDWALIENGVIIVSSQPDPCGPSKSWAAVVVGGVLVGATDGASPVADVYYWGSAILAGVGLSWAVSGDTSLAEYEKHKSTTEEMINALLSLESAYHYSKGPKRRTPIKEKIEELKKQIEGHIKEMKQKWPHLPRPEIPKVRY